MSLVNTQPAVADAPSNRRRWRFSLGTLILATALGLAILANYLQFRDVQTTKQYLWHRHMVMSEELNGILRNHEEFNRTTDEDWSRVRVSLVPTESSEEWLWQIALPEQVTMPYKPSHRLCLATEGIPSDGVPQQSRISFDLMGPTWLKVRFEGDGAVVACQSFRRPYAYEPNRVQSRHPIQLRNMHGDLELNAIVGKSGRESFPPEAPPILIRMRKRKPISDPDGIDVPGPGFMIWLEKLPAK